MTAECGSVIRVKRGLSGTGFRHSLLTLRMLVTARVTEGENRNAAAYGTGEPVPLSETAFLDSV